MSTPSTPAVAAATTVTGSVTGFQFGGPGTTNTIEFTVTDSSKTAHHGAMTTNINDKSSAGFAIVFTNAMASGYKVTVSSANGTTYDSVAMLLPTLTQTSVTKADETDEEDEEDEEDDPL
ncbi:hypothetical protein PHO31112_05322 [Pandoraea horticolens]|uniref:Uncharacterized protein n=1 Tax=Pandoraea horticolens TaxID=2508298 RepID=A0A5E4ZD61_9BURK|nr:hypothetical protein [Pandoraea horticolens]VVE58462.1 hypothetical protein PHO31112_05322 [Pandoraea horticolens]